MPDIGNPDAGGTAGTGTGFHNIDQLLLGKTLQVSYGKRGRVSKIRSKGYPKGPAPKHVPKI